MNTRLVTLFCLLLLMGVAVAGFCVGPVPVQEILSGKYTNETVDINGITAKKVRGTTLSTKVYAITDDYNDSVKVRTDEGDPDIGTRYAVRGTVVFQPQSREYYIIEKKREHAAGSKDTVDTSAAPPPAAATKDSSDEGSKGFLSNLREKKGLLIAGAGLLVAILVLVVVLLVTGSAGKKRAAEEKQRLIEAEKARRADMPRSKPTDTVAQSARQDGSRGETRGSGGKDTLETWGTIEVAKGPMSGKSFVLSTREVKIGREDAGVLLSEDASASREHGRLVQSPDGKVFYVDKSRNGSRVNGNTVQGQVEVKSGDTIEVGTSSLKLTILGQAAVNSSTPKSDISRKETIVPEAAGARASKAATAEFLGAELKVIQGPDESRVFPVTKSITTIGRTDGQDVQLTDATVSREHLTISTRNGDFVLENLSTKGTKIKDEPVDEHVLSSGDEIHIGGTVLQFSKL